MNSILYFTADWCGPCKMMAPHIQQIASEGVAIKKVNVNASPELAKAHKVQSIPTFIQIDSTGKELKRKVGAMSLPDLRAFTV